MILQNFAPSLKLRSCIKKYYLVEGDFGEKTYDVFFADGCLEIVFNLDVAFYRDDVEEHWAKVIGQIVEPLHVKAKGQGKSFGIWFYPHGFAMISRIPAEELTGKAIALDAVLDKDFIDFVGTRLVKNDMNGLIDGLNTYFEGILKNQINAPKVAVANRAVRRLPGLQDELSLNELAKECNVSQRYLQKIFLERVGLRPKQFQRIVRFQKALEYLNAKPAGRLTTIAHDAGYFDQSHFIREFKKFTGLRPSQYQPDNHPINQYFLTP